MSFLLESGQTLVCLGDSITQSANGYVSVMAALIAARYPERAIHVVNAGISGNKAPDILARLKTDVLRHQPDWVTVNVGINDVWHGLDNPAHGVPLDRYESTVAQIVSTLQNASAQVILVSPTVIGEDVDAPANQSLQQYVLAMERVAQARGVRVAPAHADFVMTIRVGQAAAPQFCLTTDGVHMNAVGNARMALTILETFGF